MTAFPHNIRLEIQIKWVKLPLWSESSRNYHHVAFVQTNLSCPVPAYWYAQASHLPRPLVRDDSYNLLYRALLLTKRYRSRLWSRKTGIWLPEWVSLILLCYGGYGTVDPLTPHTRGIHMNPEINTKNNNSKRAGLPTEFTLRWVHPRNTNNPVISSKKEKLGS